MSRVCESCGNARAAGADIICERCRKHLKMPAMEEIEQITHMA